MATFDKINVFNLLLHPAGYAGMHEILHSLGYFLFVKMRLGALLLFRYQWMSTTFSTVHKVLHSQSWTPEKPN